jgi:hypothetical protein
VPGGSGRRIARDLLGLGGVGVRDDLLEEGNVLVGAALVLKCFALRAISVPSLAITRNA